MEPTNGRVAKILIISDQQTVTGALTSLSLQQQKYTVVAEPKAANAVKRWSEEQPGLIIVDLNHPKSLILQLIHALRAETITPILLLSRSLSIEDQQEMYDAGIDDCLLKPVSPSIFLAKIRVWLRHSWSVPSETRSPLRVGNFSLLPSERAVMTGRGKRIELTNLELRLLYALMSRPRHTVSSEELIQLVWGDASAADTTVLKSLIYRLRQKMEADPNAPALIRTTAGHGYVFTAV